MMDKSKTVLVVIDLQKGIVGVPGQPHPSDAVVMNAAKLAVAFRKNRMPVFLVRVTPSVDGRSPFGVELEMTENNNLTGVCAVKKCFGSPE